MPRFSELAAAVETRYWNQAKAKSIPMVPMVTAGWDKRPRKDHPVSWEIGHPYHTQDIFPSVARPPEIAAHLNNSLRFVHENPSICTAKTVIIYGWNEHDEGGWICPTYGKGGITDTSRLDAIRTVLR